MRERELIIVGGGPAGMAAAIAAHKAGIKDILLLERDQQLGGILNQCIHPGFGLHYFKKELTGPEYAERFIKEVEKNPEIEVSLRSMVIKLTADKKLTYGKAGGAIEVKAKALIMATGCRERTREMVHIPGTRPAGIFPAGLAQKMINLEGWLPGKEIVIIGSGDIGLIMARRFILEGCQVKAIIEIQKQSRGLARNIAQCVQDFDIPLYFNHRVLKIYGKNRVAGLTFQNMESKEKFDLACDTVLVSVGLIPENELIEMAGVSSATPGVFVCGNSFKVYDLVDSVTRDSEKAGQTAAQYLRGEK